MDVMTILGKIQRLMDARGTTQQMLAAAIGVHQTRVSKWINGTGRVDSVSALRIARYFGVDLNSLCDDAYDEPAPERAPNLDEVIVLDMARTIGVQNAKRILMGVAAEGPGWSVPGKRSAGEIEEDARRAASEIKGRRSGA